MNFQEIHFSYSADFLFVEQAVREEFWDLELKKVWIQKCLYPVTLYMGTEEKCNYKIPDTLRLACSQSATGPWDTSPTGAQSSARLAPAADLLRVPRHSMLSQSVFFFEAFQVLHPAECSGSTFWLCLTFILPVFLLLTWRKSVEHEGSWTNYPFFFSSKKCLFLGNFHYLTAHLSWVLKYTAACLISRISGYFKISDMVFFLGYICSLIFFFDSITVFLFSVFLTLCVAFPCKSLSLSLPSISDNLFLTCL